jgi:hypothetical protein
MHLIRPASRRAIGRLPLLAVLVLSLSACDFLWEALDEWLATFERRWTEDVQLSNGSVVVIERAVRVRESDAFGGGAYSAVEREASLKFTGELAHLPKWNVPLIPLLLYVDELTSEWVIVATTMSCEVIYERGNPRYWFAADKPRTKYFEFRLRKTGWVQVPLSERSIGRPTNLVFRYKSIETSHVTAATKEQLRRESVAEYLSIVERPERNCMPTTNMHAIWEAEDQVLKALESESATPEQRARVEELLASTRFLYLSPQNPASRKQDSDPGTVQILHGGRSGVSVDGQIIYSSGASRSEQFLKESYSRRLRAAGLGQFAK